MRKVDYRINVTTKKSIKTNPFRYLKGSKLLFFKGLETSYAWEGQSKTKAKLKKQIYLIKHDKQTDY